MNFSNNYNGLINFFNPYQKTLQLFSFLVFFSTVTIISVNAEGTKELAPNGSITVEGNMTNDIAALNIGNEEYSFFAEFEESDADARLYINIQDPNTESIYLGFSAGHKNQAGLTPDNVPFRYYIKDPMGNIVFTSQEINTTTANINGWQEAFNGPNAFNAGGYNANIVDSGMLTSGGNTLPGDYYIEFEILLEDSEFDERNGRFLLIDYWDITVENSGSPRTGRIWSNNWGLFAINDYGFPNRPFNGAFYVCAPDPADLDRSYITRIDFNDSGFRPGGFNVLFNSFGIDPNLPVEESRKSLMGTENGSNVAIPEYDIYLNDPVDICETAAAGMIQLNGATTCDGNANYCIEFLTDKPGTINLLLDFDGNDGVYTPNTADLLMSRTISMSEINSNQCFDWDGLDGMGNAVDGIRVLLSYEQGVYHFPIYDAEFLTKGFNIERVRPTTAEVPKLFYDDSGIESDPYMVGPQPPKVQLSGCDTPCHNWDNFTPRESSSDPIVIGYGNLNTINSWWFSNRIVLEETLEFPAILNCNVNGNLEICEGEQTTLELEFLHTPSSSTMPGISNITWSGPGIVNGINSEVATVNAGGVYTADVEWITPTGGLCNSICSAEVVVSETISTVSDTTVLCLEDFEIDGVSYEITQDTVFVTNFTTNDGCLGTDSLFVSVETPTINVECELIPESSSICEGETTLINVNFILDGSEEYVNDETITYSFSDNVIEEIVDFDEAEFSARVSGGETYTFELNYLSECTGEMYTTFCETTVEVNETVNTKTDTIIDCLSFYEFNGVEYQASQDTTLVGTTTDASGCTITDSLCVTVVIPNQSITCEMFGPQALCEGDTAFVSVDFDFGDTATFPRVTGGGFSTNVFDQTIAFGDEIRVWGYVLAGEEATFTINYENTCTGEMGSSTCSVTVGEFPNQETKVDTIVGFGEVFEANGVIYNATGNYTQELTTANGCDSTVVYCVVVEIPDVSLTCSIDGPEGICLGEFDNLNLSLAHTPANAPFPTINTIVWSGTGINNSGDTGANVRGGSTYTADITYTNIAGETRTTSCSIDVASYPVYEVEIDTIIEKGQIININGIDYDAAGEFVDPRTTSNGCDSIIIITIIEEANMLCYDLNDCKSSDYSNFTSKLNPEFDCAIVSASVVFRENPAVNGHSCTEGPNGTNAMCISSYDSCTFDAGNERSAVIEIAILPEEGQSVRITSLDFFEAAPETFRWIVGHTGVNNYPEMYGVRVLKDGQEIFASIDNPTTRDWTEERFRFSGNNEFIVDAPAFFRFEFLGYCTVDNGGDVNAWDLDEIKINASCTSAEANQVVISGNIFDIKGEPLSQVEVSLDSDNPSLPSAIQNTDDNGEYAFEALKKGYDYFVKPNLNKDFLRGVTTIDLIEMQRHILGIKKFASPYQMIAADVNNSESITAIDILELRKLILGIYEEFPNNESYRFAKAGQEIALGNPWVLDESEMMNSVEEDKKDMNFNAIKIGDVSSLTNGGRSINPRSNSTASIKAENVYAKRNEVIELDFELANVTELEGFQFALDLNNVEFINLDGLDENGVAYNLDKANNMLKVSWFAKTSTDIVNFKLNLLANVDGWASDMVKINETEIVPVAYSGLDLNESKLNIDFNNKVIAESMSVNPNPFTESFNIEMTSSEERVYTVSVFDISGKLLYNAQNEVVNGTVTKNISKTDIRNYKGVVVVKINNGETMMTRRILSL